jgi:hypothetical protein
MEMYVSKYCYKELQSFLRLRVLLVIVLAVSAFALVSARQAGASSNETCGTAGSLTGCVSSWSNGLVVSYTGDVAGEASQGVSWINKTGTINDGKTIYCEGPNYSVFIPLPADQYTGSASLITPTVSGPNQSFTFNLQVGGSNTTPAPQTSCAVAPPPSQNGTVTFPTVNIASNPNGSGYWLVDSRGDVEAFNGATWHGDLSGTNLVKPIVGITATADGGGYWLDASDGGIFAFGDAQFYGSMGGKPLNKPMVSMAATADGGGYWLVASDGGIFAFGDAQFYGSTGSIHLNQPVVGIAVDFHTGGYWMVASDGGIFAFNAPFLGSTGSIHLSQPIIDMEADPNGSGYRFVASDGGIFCYGLPYEGSLPGNNVHVTDVSGMAPSGTDGYWVVQSTSFVTAFGSATNGSIHLGR